MEKYIASRLAVLGVPSESQNEIEALKAENARLKEQLEQSPAVNFKSEAQIAFEQSPEFETILNAYFLRFMRDKYGSEFRASRFLQEFQATANAAFDAFESNYKKQGEKPSGKEVIKYAQTGKRNTGANEADT